MRQDFDSAKFMENRTLDENNLASEMGQVSSLLGFYGEQVALWQGVLDNIKLQLEVRDAEIRIDLKAGSVKYSVAEADAMVVVDPAYSRLKKAELKAKEQLNLYKIAVDAIDKKGNMASSIGAMKRSEMSNLYSGGYVSGPVPYIGTPLASRIDDTVSVTATEKMTPERRANIEAMLAGK